MLKIILITILFLNNYVYNLNSNDICYKAVECNGHNKCDLSNCKGKLDYDCNRMECTRNAELCDEYQEMLHYLNQRKSIYFDKQKTLSTMRGVPFVTRTLRKFENIKNNIKEC